MSEAPTALVMAAGHGTRMKSSLPKVLHPVCGRPMVEWVIAAAREAGATRTVCVIRPGEVPADQLPDGVEVTEQTNGEGTGAAVLAARDTILGEATVLILSGDHPLISAELIGELAHTHAREGAAATILTTDQLDPAGYGRVIRAADDSVDRIVETKYPDQVAAEELAVREVNIGSYVFTAGPLFEALDAVEEEDGERYLTSVFPVLKERGEKVSAHRTTNTENAMGVNDHADLAEVERRARARLVREHARNGVTFVAPETAVIEAGVEIGVDTTIEQGVTLRGATRIGAGATIGPHTTIADSTIGDEVQAPHCHITAARVANGAMLGPFSYLRPDADIGENAKIGAFVEVKNSHVGAGAKVPHLSYIGDADIGEEANVAAGNITANYDGRRKHRTKIGKRVKTGVDTSFVAPVTVGDDAYTGAGSVITEDVPDGALGIARPEQENVEGYAKRVEEDPGQ